MTLARTFRANTRIDHDDLDGLLSVLDREIAELGEDGDARTSYYVGARIALSIVRHHEFVDTQADFMRLIRHYIDELEGGQVWE